MRRFAPYGDGRVQRHRDDQKLYTYAGTTTTTVRSRSYQYAGGRGGRSTDRRLYCIVFGRALVGRLPKSERYETFLETFPADGRLLRTVCVTRPRTVSGARSESRRLGWISRDVRARVFGNSNNATRTNVPVRRRHCPYRHVSCVRCRNVYGHHGNVWPGEGRIAENGKSSLFD